jgi:hypothetical protein
MMKAEEKFILTLLKTTKPFASKIVGDLWQITAEKESRPSEVSAADFFQTYYKLICNGVVTIPLGYGGIFCFLAPSGLELSQFDWTTPLGNDIKFFLKKEKIQGAPIRTEASFRKPVSFLVRRALELAGVRRLGPSKYFLRDLLKLGAQGLEWLQKEVEGQEGLLSYTRYCYPISEAFDDGHGAIICRTRTTVNLTDEQGRQYSFDIFLEKYDDIKDYIVHTENMENRVVIRWLLDGRAYAPISIEYRSPRSYRLEKYNMTLYEKLKREYQDKPEKLKLIESSKDDPFVVVAYRYRPGRMRLGEPCFIPPSTATPIVTVANREFYEEKMRRSLPWEDVTRLDPKLHFYGAVAIRRIVNSANMEVFGTEFEFDEPLYVERMLRMRREEAQKYLLYRIPAPTLLLRDKKGNVTRKRITGSFRTDVLRPGDEFPYLPLTEEKLDNLAFSIIYPKPEIKKAKALKQVLERSKIIDFLFGEKGRRLAEIRRLLGYEYIDVARSDLYQSKIRNVKNKHLGHFALIPTRKIPIAAEIYKLLKHESTFNNIAIQPIQLREAFTFFDFNLWYAMFRKIGCSAVGLDTSDLNLPNNFVAMARDVSGRKEDGKERYAALTSSVGPDMVQGFILAERATVKGETIENIYDILDMTKERVWKRKIGAIPSAIVSMRDGYTPPLEHGEEIRFYEENDISYVTIDVLKDAGGKFLKRVMKKVEPYNVPLVALLLDDRTAVVQPHKIRVEIPPSPVKIKISAKSGKDVDNFTIYDAANLVTYSTFMTHATPAWEYVKTPDVIAKAHRAADLYKQGALPTAGIFWVGHLD